MRISDWSSDVCSSDLVLPKGEYFRAWEFRQASKRKGGRIYIEVRDTGEIDIHEGYVTAKEAARLDKGETIDAAPKTARPELTARMQTYIDLHRHAAVRAELTGHPAVRSEEHTSELQSLMRLSYAVFCLKKTKTTTDTPLLIIQ